MKRQTRVNLMRPIFFSNDELQIISSALEQECLVHLETFQQAQAKGDVLSQRRAVRAAKDVRRLHQIIDHIEDCLEHSSG
jgi:hypothetical protein